MSSKAHAAKICTDQIFIVGLICRVSLQFQRYLCFSFREILHFSRDMA